MQDTFIQTLKEEIVHSNLFPKNAKLLIAVSGGMDSMCLWDALTKIHEGTIEVAHVNYKLRAEESEMDENLVKQYCDKKQQIFHLKTADLSELHSGIQEKSRKIRYTWFYDLLKDRDLDFIVTAHHLDDQMETVIQRLIRGTGLKGITGIELKNDHLVRPMLRIPRNFIEQYQELHNVPYRQDASNFTNVYTRNFIRNEVFQPLKKYFQDLPFGFDKSIRNFKSERILQQDLLGYWSRDNVNRKGNYYHIPIKELQKLDSGSTLLFHLLEGQLEIEFIHQLLHSGGTGTRIDKNNFSILLDRNDIILRPYIPETTVLQIPKEGIYTLPQGKFTLSKVDKPEFSKDKDLETALIPSKDFPLTIRYWKEGDRFQPLGMEGMQKKLSDYYIDEKINALYKEEIPILTNCNDEVIWVLGQRLDDRFKVNKQSGQSDLYKLAFTEGLKKPISQSFEHLP